MHAEKIFDGLVVLKIEKLMNRLLKIFENIPNVRVAMADCKKDYRRLDSPTSIVPSTLHRKLQKIHTFQASKTLDPGKQKYRRLHALLTCVGLK